MKRKRKRKSKERICIELSPVQKEMLDQLADDEQKSYSSIVREGLDLYFNNHVEKRKVLSEFGL